MKKAWPFTVLWVLALLVPAVCSGQPAQHWGVALHAGVSHSGWNLALVGQYRQNDFQFYLGPYISLNRGLPGKGPLGLNAGADYIIQSNKTWLASVVNLDYQAGFFPSSGNTDVIHEFMASYGLRINAGDRLYFIQQMGCGFFLESFYLENENKRQSVTGYNGLLRLRAGYLF